MKLQQSGETHDWFHRLNWDDTGLSLYAKTSRDVELALSKTQLSLEDFKALLSPAAEPYVEVMAQRAFQLTRQRFGNTIQLYQPMYLSNLCANSCTYCGFTMENKIKRRTLSVDEIHREIDAIQQASPIQQLLIVTGEHETKVGMNYFEQVVPIIRERVSALYFEVQPLNEADYVRLRQWGVDGVMVYQESYNPVIYAQHHLRGNKQDFYYRLDTADRLGRAGIDKIGLGALIGLSDWRIESMYVATHLDYLQHKYWRSRYSISFPRLRPCTGGVELQSNMSDKQLVQLLSAYRLFSHEVELSLSTREPAALRDNLFPLGVTSVSAASKTDPGGYTTNEGEQRALSQFDVSDERSVQQVVQAIQAKGLQPVWKDWQAHFSR